MTHTLNTLRANSTSVASSLSSLSVSSLQKILKETITHTYDLAQHTTLAQKLVPFLDNSEVLLIEHYFGSRRTSAISVFLKYASLAQVKEQKEVFIKNKDKAVFAHLVFTCDYDSSEFEGADKLEALLSWGYNANLALNESFLPTPSPSNLEIVSGMRPLHFYKSPKIIKMLLNAGADPHATIRLYPHLEEMVQQKITKIKTQEDYLALEAALSKAQQKIMSWVEFEDLHPYNAHEYLKPYEAQLALTGKDLNAYAWALAKEQRPKYLILRNYEKQEDLTQTQKTAFEPILDLIKKSPGKKQTIMKMIYKELRQTNHYALEHLEEVKKYITPQLLAKLIADNQKAAVHEILKNNWVAKTAKTPQNDSFLQFAVRHNKTDIFKMLDEHGYNDDLSGVFDRLNALLSIEEFKNVNKKSAKTKFKGMPNGIIYYMADKGYRFDNQIVLKYVIDIEKEKIEKGLKQDQALTEKTENAIALTKKQFKL